MVGELRFESVSDDGSAILRCPGGSTFELSIPAEMVRYYRRLVPAAHGPERT
ncbi:MAG TPA: hypothetical protein VFG83_09950 [Kofleriaceae bacterium]|nr:hypothetical protein [Kofleriaceae bacterium]